MYAVIFRAEIKEIDEAYYETAARLRQLALDKYDCHEFVSVTEGHQEISISYWQSEAQIKQWKQNVEHMLAQTLGKSRWYKSYQVQIVEIQREYASS